MCIMFENNKLQTGLVNTDAKINAKAEIKASENMHNQFGGTTTYNNNDNSKQILQQNFIINVLPGTNVDESIKKALSYGNKNAKEVGIEVKKLLKENNISEEKVKEILSNPEVLSTIAKANEVAYTTNDDENKKILSDLIYSKIVATDDEYSNALSQAIVLMKNLTKNHLKIVAFIYLLQSKYLKYNTNAKNFIEFYDKYIVNLINIPDKKLSDLGSAVLGNGLAVAYTLGWNVISFLPNNFYDALDGRYIDDIDIKSKISTLDATCNRLGISSSFLTPVGKCIGYCYLKDVLGLEVIYKDK